MRYCNARRVSIFLAACVLLAVTLACNIPFSSQESSESVPETVNTVTATAAQPVEAPTEESSPTDNSTVEENPGNPNTSETGVGDLSTTGDNDIRASLSIKNANETYEGNISFPGNDTSDNITIKPIDFDDTKTSGQLIFTLACSGQGKAKVNYKGGAVRSGVPGCGETWTVDVTNGSPDSHILIRLDASGDVNWSLSVTNGE